jgi:tRNA threonylcarbamoyl adenosine modification protein YeaZ
VIIAIESASSDPSLALAEPDGLAFAHVGWSGENRQGSELLPRLLALLASHGRDLGEASAVAVGVGPGSFTGLRVGMGLAKGISLARAIPIVGLPSLVAWLEAEPEASAALSRAGAHDGYLMRRGDTQPEVVTGESLQADPPPSPCIAPAELAAAFGLVATRAPHRAAVAIAAAAAARLRLDPAGDDLGRLEPAYLRAPRGLAPSEGEISQWP